MDAQRLDQHGVLSSAGLIFGYVGMRCALEQRGGLIVFHVKSSTELVCFGVGINMPKNPAWHSALGKTVARPTVAPIATV